MGKCVRWGDWEDQIIEDWFPISAEECRKRIPHRTIVSVYNRASRRGVRGNKGGFKDLTGNIYGVYKVMRRGKYYTSLKGYHSIQWEVECTNCGTTKLINGSNLKRGKYSSCSKCSKLEIGKMYGWLEPIERLKDYKDSSGKNYQKFKVKCHYGAEGCLGEFDTRANSILSEHTNSCGCFQRETVRKLMVGENNPNSKPEGAHLTRLVDRYYKFPGYTKLREKAMKRDDYTCIVSGKRGVELNEHHIIPRNYYFKRDNITTWKQVLACKELWDINNLITISEEWHLGNKTNNSLALHKIYHGGIYTEEDYYIWLRKIKGDNK